MPATSASAPSADDRALAAASAVQAAAMLPLHLMPLLVHLAAVAWGASSLAAGSYAAAFSLGQLAATLALPALAGALPFALLVAVGGTTLSASVAAIGASSVPIVAAWAAAGFGSGALIVASTIAIARYRRPVFAFSARLAASLLVGAVGALALGLLHGHVGPRGSFEVLAATIVVLAVSAIAVAPLRRLGPSITPAVRTAMASRRSLPTARVLLGLVLLCALFAGQVGTIVLLVRRVVAGGVALSDAVMVMAACKCTAAVFVVATARARSGTRRVRTTAVLLAASVALMSVADDLGTLTAALLVWELCVNRLSAVMQGTLAALSPGITGAWSSALLLGGAAVGPVLHGAALDHGAGPLFLAFAMASAIAAGLWSTGGAAAVRNRAE
ncbi:MAG: hypothetical protein ACK54X_22915 [Burkholderiales bacterium]|jgi:hypothetical protein